MLTRPRLLARLDASPEPALVVITAPAGYGKTVLVRQWAARFDHSAYLRLAQSHADGAVLMHDLAGALTEAVPRRQVDAVPVRALEPELQAAARLAEAVAELDHLTLLVLDDVHVLEDRRAADALALFAQLAPTSLRIVMAGHDASALHVARLRAADLVVEIGASELAFGTDETLALAQLLGLQLPEEEAALLVAETRGWPVAIALALHSLERSTSASSPGSRALVTRSVAEYIRSELLDPLAPEERAWLLRSSALEVVSGSLCDAALEVTGSLARLRRYETSSVLVQPLDDAGTEYRYHPLLRTLLRDQLEVEMPGEAVAVAARAARWCDAAGMVPEALEYAEAAGDHELVAGLIVRHVWPLHWSGRIATLERSTAWLEREGVRDRYVSVAVLAGFIHAIDGRRQTAELWLATAESSPDPGPMPDGSSAQAWIAALRGMLALHGVASVEADARLAAAQMRADSPFMPGVRLLAAVSSLMAGRLEEAVDRTREALELSEALGAMPGFAMTTGIASMLALRTGDRVQARRLIERGLERLGEAGIEDYVLACLVHAIAARLAATAGSRRDALQHLTHIHRLRPMMTASVPWLSLPVRYEAIEALVALQDVASARTLMREADDILRIRPDLGTIADDAVALRARLERIAGSTAGHWTLTAAELRVLQYLPTHLTFAEIAERLYVSPHTVKSQAVAIYSKLGVSSRRAAIEEAVDRGLLDGSALRFPLGPGIDAGIG